MQKVRYSNAQFQAKTSEIALRELAGNLVLDLIRLPHILI
jgi:hypothetical protein